VSFNLGYLNRIHFRNEVRDLRSRTCAFVTGIDAGGRKRSCGFDLLSSTTPFGKAVRGAEEGDEIEFEQEDGRRRKALIESVARGNVANDRGAADETQALTSAA
jgi:hypothetical protein